MSALLVAVAALLMWLPGALLARCAGASRGLAVALGPSLTWGVVAAGVFVLPALGLAWRPAAVAGLALALALVLLTVRRAASWRAPVERPGRLDVVETAAGGPGGGARSVVTAVVGVAAAGVVPVVLARRSGVGLGSVDQLWDAVWHANLTTFIARTGSVSPLRAPEELTGAGWRTASSFYPDALHALAALVVDVTGAAPLPGLMAVVALSYVVVLPAGTAALVWQLTRGNGAAAAVAAVVSELSVAFPTDQWWRGVWAYGVSLAVAPMACALVVAGLRGALRTPGTASAPLRAAVATTPSAALGVAGLALLQPAAAVLAALVLGAWLTARVLWLRWWIAVPVVTAVLAGATRLPDLVWTLVAHSPTLASLASFDYTTLPYTGPALRQVLGLVTPVDPTLGYPVPPAAPQVALAVVLLAAAAIAVTTREGVWLVAVQALVVAAAVSTVTHVLAPLHALTLFFYSSSYRLVAVEAVVGALLAGVATDRVLGLARRRPAPGSRRVVAVAVVAATAVGLAVIATGTLARGEVRMRAGFAPRVVGPAQVRVMSALARQSGPPGSRHARILTDSVDGSPWMYALTGAMPMFTHYAAGTVPDDVAYLGRHLDEVDASSRVQRILLRRHVCFVYSNDTTVTARRHRARGFEHLDQARSLHLVARAGDAAAYRVELPGSACTPGEGAAQSHGAG